MRILAIDPLAPWGHINFNTFLLKALRSLGHVSFITFHDYHKHFTVDTAIDIPDKRGLHRRDRTLRMGQPLILDAILRTVHPADYDVVVFLCYESISMALKWPKDARVFVLEHNSTDKARGNPFKMFFYKRIPRSVIHLVFMEYIGNYISRTTGRRAIYIPHPYYSDPAVISAKPATVKPELIFCPSSGTRSRVLRPLKRFVEESDRYRLIAKGRREEDSPRCRVRRFFDDYETILAGCDMVFFGGEYEYRVSGVAHEAMSYGKPIATLNCLFGREFSKRFPHMVRPVDRMDEIGHLSFDPETVRKEHVHFLRENGFEAICAALREAFSASGSA